MKENWHALGAIAKLQKRDLAEATVGRIRVALSCVGGEFAAVSGVCNHAGGPLGEGRLAGEYIVCPWHNWKYHRKTGEGEPGFEEDRLPRHDLREEDGKLYLNSTPATARHKSPHPPHPLERPIERAPGPIRVAGISTTVMDRENPRYSTSEALLTAALEHASSKLGAETKLIKLDELKFRACEGYYSKSAYACTWPCSITQMDRKDECPLSLPLPLVVVDDPIVGLAPPQDGKPVVSWRHSAGPRRVARNETKGRIHVFPPSYERSSVKE